MSILPTPIRLRNRPFLFVFFLSTVLLTSTSAAPSKNDKESPGNPDKEQKTQWQLPKDGQELSDFIDKQTIVDMRGTIGPDEEGTWDIPLPEAKPQNGGTAIQFSEELLILLPKELKKGQTATQLQFSNSHQELPRVKAAASLGEAPEVELVDDTPLVLEDPDIEVPVEPGQLDPDPLELFEGPDFSNRDGLNNIGESPTEIPFFAIDLPGENDEPEEPVFDLPENNLDAPLEFFVKILDEQKEEINQFDHTALVVADIGRYQAEFAGKDGIFFVSYENPDRPGQWIEVPVTVHQDDGLMSAEVGYFSNISIGWRPELAPVEIVKLSDVQPVEKNPKKPKKDPPPMKHQPPAEVDSLEDLAPETAKSKKLKKDKTDKKGEAEISTHEDTFITSEYLVFLVESGTFEEKVSQV